MSEPTDRVAAGIVVFLNAEEAAFFPVGTVVTQTTFGILQATIPVSKPGERPQVAHVIGEEGDTVRGLAERVRTAFPRPLSPE